MGGAAADAGAAGGAAPDASGDGGDGIAPATGAHVASGAGHSDDDDDDDDDGGGDHMHGHDLEASGAGDGSGGHRLVRRHGHGNAASRGHPSTLVVDAAPDAIAQPLVETLAACLAPHGAVVTCRRAVECDAHAWSCLSAKGSTLHCITDGVWVQAPTRTGVLRHILHELLALLEAGALPLLQGHPIHHATTTTTTAATAAAAAAAVAAAGAPSGGIAARSSTLRSVLACLHGQLVADGAVGVANTLTGASAPFAMCVPPDARGTSCAGGSVGVGGGGGDMVTGGGVPVAPGRLLVIVAGH